MKNKKEATFGALDAENMIDATYNKNDYPIIEKTQNAYVMPLDMLKGEDEIYPSSGYEDVAETTKNSTVEVSRKSKNNKK